MTRLVIDIATSRLIFFAKDPEVELFPSEGAIIVEYTGELPENMLAENCWNWRYQDKRLLLATEARTLSRDESILEANRREVTKLLNERINARRQPYESELIMGDLARTLKLQGPTFADSNLPNITEPLAALHNMSVDAYLSYLSKKHLELIKTVAETEILRETLMLRIQSISSPEELLALYTEIMRI